MTLTQSASILAFYGILAFLPKSLIRNLWLHSLHHHQGREDVTYRMRTTGSYSDPLDRQLQERVNITNFKGPILMNRRNEMGGVRVERTRYRRWGGN